MNTKKIPAMDYWNKMIADYGPWLRGEEEIQRFRIYAYMSRVRKFAAHKNCNPAIIVEALDEACGVDTGADDYEPFPINPPGCNQ